MRTALAAIFAITFGLSALALSSPTTPATPAPHTQLASLLTDADKVVTATNTDLADLKIDKWSSGWKSGFTRKSSHKKNAQQTADSLKQQAVALTGMIAEVRTSHGNVSSTFKLYNNLTTVCENMDTLVEATQAYGKKEEYNRLNGDYTNLFRLRNSLASYVEQRAAVVDPKGDSSFGEPVNASATKPAELHAKKTVARRKTVLRSNN